MDRYFNSASKGLFYGKAGDLTGDDREHVKVSALAPHPITAAITYLNTVMTPDRAARPGLEQTPHPADRRGLSALFWSYPKLYGRFELDMTRTWSWTPPPAPSAGELQLQVAGVGVR